MKGNNTSHTSSGCPWGPVAWERICHFQQSGETSDWPSHPCLFMLTHELKEGEAMMSARGLHLQGEGTGHQENWSEDKVSIEFIK